VPGQAGSSSLVLTATNTAGFTNIASILVSSEPPSPFIAQFGNTGMVWTTWGNAPWFGETTNTHNGIWAAQSGAITDSQDSWLQTSIAGPGQLTFWWKVSSETNYDLLEVYTNGVLQPNFISGEVGWVQQVLTLSPGPQTVAWRYVKDPDNTFGLDAGWLSEVSFTPTPPSLQLTPNPQTHQMKIALSGILGHIYQIQYSTNLSTWSNLTVITLTNNPVIIFDPGFTSGARFYRARDLSVSLLHLDSPILTNGIALLVVHSSPGFRFDLQSSTNLTRWTSLATLTNTSGTLSYPAPRATNSPRQFYRALLLLCIPGFGVGCAGLASLSFPKRRRVGPQTGFAEACVSHLATLRFQPVTRPTRYYTRDWTKPAGYAELAGDEAVRLPGFG
jgi:hypothetical protein